MANGSVDWAAWRRREHEMTMDEEQAEKLWSLLKSIFEKILSNDNEKLCCPFEEAYRTAYTMILRKHGDKLYKGVKQMLTEHLETKVRHLHSLEDREAFLKATCETWKDIQVQLSKIQDYLMYMKRGYLEANNLPGVEELGIALFQEKIFRNDQVLSRCRDAVLHLVTRERYQGPALDSNEVEMVKNACRMVDDLGVGDSSGYEAFLEVPFLQQSAKYYREETQRFIKGRKDKALYLQYMERKINAESNRVKRYLHDSTEPRLVKILQGIVAMARI